MLWRKCNVQKERIVHVRYCRGIAVFIRGDFNTAICMLLLFTGQDRNLNGPLVDFYTRGGVQSRFLFHDLFISLTLETVQHSACFESVAR